MASPPKMQAKTKIQAQKDEIKRKVKKEHLPCPAGGRTAEGIYFPNQANHPSTDLIRFGKTSIQQKNRRSTNEETTATLPTFLDYWHPVQVLSANDQEDPKLRYIKTHQ